MRKIVIIGASGHGKVAADIAVKNRYREIMFLDDDRSVKNCGHYSVKGIVSDFKNYLNDADFFVAIGNTETRRRITEEIEAAGGQIAILIHPYAVISDDVEIGDGSVVMAGTVINTGSVIGKGCIINTSSSIDHDCKIGDFVHVAVGAHVAGNVEIGTRTWIGAGATVSNNITICGGCMVGAGAVVVENIRETGTYIGVPARNKNIFS